MKYRRAQTIVLYWHNGELTAENYLATTGDENAVALDPVAVSLLDKLSEWRDVDDVVGLFPDIEPKVIAEAMERLVECGLLLRSSPSDRQSADEEHFMRLWSSWGEEARFFHFATRNADYMVGADASQEMEFRKEVRERADGPPPPLFKTYPNAPRLYLDRRIIPLEERFGDVLTRRRTHRTFTGERVDFRVLSTLLFYTFAPMLFCDADVFGTLLMKTSPSGGARHELEGYVAIFNVEGIDPGLYHYNAEVHALELLSTDFDPAFMRRLTYGMAMPAESAVVCIVTAVFARTMYKYQHSRNYRVTLLGAGHLGQTFALCATALGLGPWQTIVFRDSELERTLQLDPYAEGAIYMFGAGRPVLTNTGLPADLKIAKAGEAHE